MNPDSLGIDDGLMTLFMYLEKIKTLGIYSKGSC